MKQKLKIFLPLLLALSIVFCALPAMAGWVTLTTNKQALDEKAESGDTTYYFIAMATDDSIYLPSSMEKDVSGTTVVLHADGQTGTANGGELLETNADFTYTRYGDTLIIPAEYDICETASLSGNLLILSNPEDNLTLYYSLNPAIRTEEQLGETVPVTGVEDLAGTWLYRYVSDGDMIIDIEMMKALVPSYTDGILVLSADGSMTLNGIDGSVVEDQLTYEDGKLVNEQGTTLSLTTEGYLLEESGGTRYYYLPCESAEE